MFTPKPPQQTSCHVDENGGYMSVPRIFTGNDPIQHVYAEPGTYTITLTATSTMKDGTTDPQTTTTTLQWTYDPHAYD